MFTCPFLQDPGPAPPSHLHPSPLRSGVESAELPPRLQAPNQLWPSLTQQELTERLLWARPVLDAVSTALTEVSILMKHSLAGGRGTERNVLCVVSATGEISVE